MSAPVYTAKTWRNEHGWTWRTCRDDKPISRPMTLVTLFRATSTRAAALEQAKLDMEWDRDWGPEEVVLNPQAAPTMPVRREPGYYVVMTAPPGPDSEFVELEDQDGRGVGPVQSGAEWRQESDYWTLGPFAPVDETPDKPYVTIHAREGVTADDIKQWLEENFQQPMSEDRGRTAMDPATIRGGNPLVNAHIEVEGLDGAPSIP